MPWDCDLIHLECGLSFEGQDPKVILYTVKVGNHQCQAFLAPFPFLPIPENTVNQPKFYLHLDKILYPCVSLFPQEISNLYQSIFSLLLNTSQQMWLEITM